jgi:hypothetical protein
MSATDPHGHVRPRPDGVKARCGGPAMCAVCAREQRDMTTAATQDPQCEGCGKRPEVYGSSWCASCHDSLPERLKNRIIAMRNALLICAGTGLRPHRSVTIQTMREHARKGLRWPNTSRPAT